MRRLTALAALLALVVAAPALAQRRAFQIDSPPVSGQNRDLIQLIDDFVTQSGPFVALNCALAGGCTGTVDYLGIQGALQIQVAETVGGFTAQLDIPSIGVSEMFAGSDGDAVFDEIEDWVQQQGARSWFDFLRAANGLTPLALLSGNPRSTVARFGDGAYRRFGYDDSRSRFGRSDKPVTRWGGFELRVDAGAVFVEPGGVAEAICSDSGDCYAFDPGITLAGDFGKHIGLSFSIMGQYRNYNGSELADVGLELALPITFLRPESPSPWYWQLAPVLQAGGGASIDLAAGGLIMGGGLVNGLSYHMGSLELSMANQILYYGGIPIDDLGGYDFRTELSQLFFKNGLDATWWPGAGFYLDAGVDFTNFAIDKAAVAWYATPRVGLGWQAGRWIDLRFSYGADLGEDDYLAHNLRLKLDFLF